MSDEVCKSIDYATTYLNVPAYRIGTLEGEGLIKFEIKEGDDVIVMNVDGKSYNIDKVHFIRLGMLAKPLTYVEERSDWGSRTRKHI